ncbi:MAG: hypothetical protein LBJ71_03570 [Holosporaceae bacterium]|jgi:hypothetical protein|nr:hypothetical protein [Holosporaceae bacterium]
MKKIVSLLLLAVPCWTGCAMQVASGIVVSGDIPRVISDIPMASDIPSELYDVKWIINTNIHAREVHDNEVCDDDFIILKWRNLDISAGRIGYIRELEKGVRDLPRGNAFVLFNEHGLMWDPPSFSDGKRGTDGLLNIDPTAVLRDVITNSNICVRVYHVNESSDTNIEEIVGRIKRLAENCGNIESISVMAYMFKSWGLD